MSSHSAGQPKQLCEVCCKLDLENMLCEETKEEPMGALSKYAHLDCPFCNLISKAVCLAWGAGWSSAKLCSATSIPPELFMQSRSPLTVKELGHTEHPQPRLLLAVDQKPPSFQQSRAIVREIDQVNNRFIIAEIESLPEASMPSGTYEVPRFLSRCEVGDHISVPLVKRWLQDCKNHQHSKKARSQKHNGLFQCEDGFRLIDVVDEHLVQRTERCDYVALSYVWGKTSTLLALKENIKRLSELKGLSSSQVASIGTARIPHTVRDAMEFTRMIGIRHLWVDTLCIVQDDDGDKARLIQRMDDVYDNAMVTIIAAAGNDADAGLMGISPRNGLPIEPTQVVDILDGTALSLAICPPSLCEEVRKVTWNTRGWTYQEQCLSQRCLYFTADEVFFNCSEVQWREGYALQDVENEDCEVKVRTGPPWWGRKLRKDPDPTPYHYLGDLARGLEIGDYQMVVQDYSRKNLSFPQDILNAFKGIFNRFNSSEDASELTISQTQGIPVRFLFQALLWFPSDDSQKRSCSATQSGGSTEQFSTWSWASWIGPVEFVFADSLWLSRNISQAPIKRVPIHVPITCWHYGGSSRRYWSSDIWKAASEAPSDVVKHATDKLSREKAYLNERIGIHVDKLISLSLLEAPATLVCGELGFLGAYLPAAEICLSVAKGERLGSMEISVHRGEFRFDGEIREVDEFVVIVAADTITKPPDTQSILLGLVTRDGISSRVGIGFIYYSKDSGSLKPQWQYKFFRVR